MLGRLGVRVVQGGSLVPGRVFHKGHLCLSVPRSLVQVGVLHLAAGESRAVVVGVVGALVVLGNGLARVVPMLPVDLAVVDGTRGFVMLLSVVFVVMGLFGGWLDDGQAGHGDNPLGLAQTALPDLADLAVHDLFISERPVDRTLTGGVHGGVPDEPGGAADHRGTGDRLHGQVLLLDLLLVLLLLLLHLQVVLHLLFLH